MKSRVVAVRGSDVWCRTRNHASNLTEGSLDMPPGCNNPFRIPC
jgi:hypothetical protein